MIWLQKFISQNITANKTELNVAYKYKQKLKFTNTFIVKTTHKQANRRI